MTWGLVLDPPEAPTISNRTMLNLNHGPIRVDQAGINWGDAAIQSYMAEQGRIGAAPVDYIVPNRTITIPLAVFTDELSGATYDQAKRMLSSKVARIQAEGGVLRRTTETGAYSPIYADIVDATLTFPDVWGETAEFENNVSLTLTALPDFYGSEIALDEIDSVAPGGVVLQQNGRQAFVLGDFPARTRIQMWDITGYDQRGVIGGFRSKFYALGTLVPDYTTYTGQLDMQARAMFPLQPAALAAFTDTVTGINYNTVRYVNLPAGVWAPVLATDLSNSGGGSGPVPNPLTHQGSYRVLCRCYSTVAAPSVRLSWNVGNSTYKTTNNAAQMVGVKVWQTLDLGQVTIQPSPIGTHQWRGQLEANAPAAGGTFYVDHFYFIPIDESSFQVTAPQPTLGQNAPAAGFDDFASIVNAAALNQRVAPLGGVWSPAGSWQTQPVGGGGSGTDFTGVTAAPGPAVQRASTADGGTFQSGGRYAYLAPQQGSTRMTDTEISADIRVTAYPHAQTQFRHGVIARAGGGVGVALTYDYVAGPVLQLAIFYPGGTTAAVLAQVAFTEQPNVWLNFDLQVGSNGLVYGQVSLQGQPSQPLYQLYGYDAALAVGGGLAGGYAGLWDMNQTVTASTRYYDNVTLRAPNGDTVLTLARKAEFRSDGFWRLANPINNVDVAAQIPRRVGDYPRLPVSGMEGRPVEMILLSSEGDFNQMADPVVHQYSAQVYYRPCWILGQ